MALVEASALGTEESLRAVANAHARVREESQAAPAPMPSQASSIRLDITTGLALITLSVVFAVGSWLMAVSAGGGKYFIWIAPFIYGLVRLTRGLDMQKRSKAGKPPSPRT